MPCEVADAALSQTQYKSLIAFEERLGSELAGEYFRLNLAVSRGDFAQAIVTTCRRAEFAKYTIKPTLKHLINLREIAERDEEIRRGREDDDLALTEAELLDAKERDDIGRLPPKKKRHRFGDHDKYVNVEKLLEPRHHVATEAMRAAYQWDRYAGFPAGNAPRFRRQEAPLLRLPSR